MQKKYNQQWAAIEAIIERHGEYKDTRELMTLAYQEGRSASKETPTNTTDEMYENIV